jgi:thiol-disulfide isomerase/thioredoxin
MKKEEAPTQPPKEQTPPPEKKPEVKINLGGEGEKPAAQTEKPENNPPSNQKVDWQKSIPEKHKGLLQADEKGNPKWSPGLMKTKNLDSTAKLNGKVIVQLSATWCGPCQAMERQFMKDPNAQDPNQRGIPADVGYVVIDAEHYPELAANYGFKGGYPNVILYNNGAEVKRFIPGGRTVDEIKNGFGIR